MIYVICIIGAAWVASPLLALREVRRSNRVVKPLKGCIVEASRGYLVTALRPLEVGR